MNQLPTPGPLTLRCLDKCGRSVKLAITHNFFAQVGISVEAIPTAWCKRYLPASGCFEGQSHGRHVRTRDQGVRVSRSTIEIAVRQDSRSTGRKVPAVPNNMAQTDARIPNPIPYPPATSPESSTARADAYCRRESGIPAAGEWRGVRRAVKARGGSTRITVAVCGLGDHCTPQSVGQTSVNKSEPHDSASVDL